MLLEPDSVKYTAGKRDARELHVAHLISNLGLGGAENSLAALIEATTEANVRHTVVSMLPGGELVPRVEAAGARVIEMECRRGPLGVLGWGSLASVMKRIDADVVQCWMYHANFAASCLQLTRVIKGPVLWGVRQGLQTLSLERRATQALIRASVPMSAMPQRIVYNSEEAAREHERIGFSNRSREVIENGINCGRFRPRRDAKAALCAELGIAGDAVIIGRVARLAKMKDFQTLLKAFSRVATRCPRAHLVVVGPSEENESDVVLGIAEALGCRDRVAILPRRPDIETLYSAMDIAVSSSSHNEGFPNSVAEALASGVLVVSTPIGASRLIRGGVHEVVPAEQPDALATAIEQLAKLCPEKRGDLGQAGRDFIRSNFDDKQFGARFAGLWRQASEAHATPARRRVNAAAIVPCV